jgi:phosphoribosylformylglycinamidine synthase
VKGTKRGIAVSTDCNSLYCYLDPFEGGKIAVAESARNVVCSGARPVAITNCLNFGNPMKPDVFWQFHQSVNGMIASCKALNTPVTGGNVSFYNESPKAAIYPTPTVGMVGILDDLSKRVPSHFQNEGDILFLAGDTYDEIGGSHYLMIEHGLKKGLPPRLDLAKEKALQNFILAMGDSCLLKSCHDLAEGGLAVALAESCFGKEEGIGAVVDQLDLVTPRAADKKSLRKDSLLFGESQSRVLITVKPEHKEEILRKAKSFSVPLYQIGRTGGKELHVGDAIRAKIADLREIYDSAIPKKMEQ